MEVAHIRMFEWLSPPKIDWKKRVMMGVQVQHSLIENGHFAIGPCD